MKFGYYAIYYGAHPNQSKASRPSRITRSWATCKQLTAGVSHVIYKKFASRSEAALFLEQLERGESASKPEKPTQNKSIRVYVDGSFSEEHSPSASWAWAAVQEENLLAEAKGLVGGKALSRNIDGECEATKQALLWAKGKGLKVVLVYDYSGIWNWLDGSWKPKSLVARRYVDEVLELSKGHKFEKTISHTGDPWNDYVDGLAKSVFRGLGRGGLPLTQTPL